MFMFPSRTASRSVRATLVVNLFAWMTPCQKHHQMAVGMTPCQKHHQMAMGMTPCQKHHQMAVGMTPCQKHHQMLMDLMGNWHKSAIYCHCSDYYFITLILLPQTEMHCIWHDRTEPSLSSIFEQTSGVSRWSCLADGDRQWETLHFSSRVTLLITRMTLTLVSVTC